MYRQVSHERLHIYCTKSQQRFLQAGDFVVYHLYLIQAHIYHATLEQTLLGDLYEPLIGDDEHAEIPADIPRHEYQRTEDDTGQQAKPEQPETWWIIRPRIRENKDIYRADKPGTHAEYQPFAHHDGMLAEHEQYFFIIKLVIKVFNFATGCLFCFGHKRIVSDYKVIFGAPKRIRTASFSLGRSCFIH